MSPKLKTELGQLPPNELVEVVQWAVLRLRDVEALELLFKQSNTEQVAEIERQWLEECTKRAEAVDRGDLELIPGDVVRQRTLESLRRVNRGL